MINLTRNEERDVALIFGFLGGEDRVKEYYQLREKGIEHQQAYDIIVGKGYPKNSIEEAEKNAVRVRT